MTRTPAPVIVIGGGLAGFAATATLARAGRPVTLLEKSAAPGGRAATHVKEGFSFNLGPHALYRGGAAERVLAALGVTVRGKRPPNAGAALVGPELRRHMLPGGAVSLLSTGLLSFGAKKEAGRWLRGLAEVDPEPLRGTPLQAWVDETIEHTDLRPLVHALFRVSTYANAPDRMSAGDGVRQIQVALRNGVLYLDGGWQSIVDGLRAAAPGAQVITGARAAAVETPGGIVQAVRLADGTRLRCSAVIVTGSPEGAASLLPGAPDWAAGLTPIHASCLDVALRALPRGRATFALGMDRPLYFSVHSRTARLAPDGGAVIHAAKYLPPGDPGAEEGELEQVLDVMQPGWRDLVVERRWLPHMVVSHALPEARRGGIAGRPGPTVPGLQGAWIAGDWVGPEGHLADASLASGQAAAQAALGAAEGAERAA